MKIFVDPRLLVSFVDEAQGKKPPTLWLEHPSSKQLDFFMTKYIQSNCCSKVLFVFRRESSVMPRHQVTRLWYVKFRTGPSGTHLYSARSVNIYDFQQSLRIRIRIRFGSGSVGPVDLVPDCEYSSGTRQAKKKTNENFMLCPAGCFGCFCSMENLHGVQRINILQFFNKKNLCIFFSWKNLGLEPEFT